MITYDFLEKSACIKKYFNSEEQKYYDIDEPKFKWPEMSHGTLNPNNKFYTFFIESCKEETISLILGEGNHCRRESEIDEKIGITSGAHLYYIDYYIDVLNYKNPNKKFFSMLQNSLKVDSYVMNHLNFNPSIVKTHNGLILNNYQIDRAYLYERNDVFTYTNTSDRIYTVYYLWLNNRV